jgi:hypothetical protein
MADNTITGQVQGNTDNNSVSNVFAGGSSLISGWLSGIGGDIASGLEGGAVAFFRDLWTVIVGPLEIIAGIAILIFFMSIYFRGDISGLMGAGKLLAA